MTWNEGTMEAGAVKISRLIAPCFAPVYRAARSGAYDELWLTGGRGSGKSSFASLYIVLGVMRDVEANAIVYRKVAETLRDSVYSQMIWAIEALGVSHLWRYGLSPLELCYVPTGQRILFRGTDKPEKSKGVKLRRGAFQFLWFEELTEFGGMYEIRTVKASVLRGGGATASGGVRMIGSALSSRTALPCPALVTPPTAGRSLPWAVAPAGHTLPSVSVKNPTIETPVLRTFQKGVQGEALVRPRGEAPGSLSPSSPIASLSPITFYTYNPPMNAMDWVNVEGMSPRCGRLRHHSDYRDMPPEWLGVSFLREAEALRQWNERAYRHMYLGEVTGTGGRVFENLSLRSVTPEEWGGLPTYCGHDFGFAIDPDACVKCAYDARRRTLYVVGEFVRTGMSLNALAEALRRLCGREVVTADSADPRGIAELRALGVCAVSARKGPGSVERGVKWLQTLACIVIDPIQCPTAAGEFQRYEYERDGQGGFMPRYPDRGNHTIDAVRYAVESLTARRVAMAVR